MRLKKFSNSSNSQSLKSQIKARFQTHASPTPGLLNKDSIEAVLFDEQENKTGKRVLRGSHHTKGNAKKESYRLYQRPSSHFERKNPNPT
jgi:hypothetical protein